MRGPLTCGLCDSELTYIDSILEDGVRSTSWRCDCGETYGCCIDAGELDILDLGLERAEPHLGAQNNYAAFYENFERTLTEAENVTDRLTGSGDR